MSFTLNACSSISSISSFFSPSTSGACTPAAKCRTLSQSSFTFLPTMSCSLRDSWNCSMSKQGISMKLSIEASSRAFTTKLFMTTRSLKRQLVAQLTKSRVWLSWCIRSNDWRMGMRALMMLYNLKIQMNLILLPLRKMSSQGISPCRQVWYNSSLVDSFIRQLQSGMSSSSQMNTSKFSGLGQISLCLNLLGLVNTLIFLFKIISQMSNLHTLLIQISTIMIFNLRLLLPFSQSCFMMAFSRGYSWDSLLFYQKSKRVLEIDQAERESEIRFNFFSYLMLGSYLKRAFTSFIPEFIYYFQREIEQQLGNRQVQAGINAKISTKLLREAAGAFL